MQSRPQIEALENHLLRCPGDLRARYLLGLYLESEQPGSEVGREHLLTWLVAALGYDDAGSAEHDLRARAVEEQDSRSGLMLGHLLAYGGRQTQAERLLRQYTRWQVRRTARFELHAAAGSTAEREMAEISAAREQGIARIEELLGIGPAPGQLIRYFFYETELHKRVITGDAMPAHAYPTRSEVHAVYGLGSRVSGIHEDVHVVLRQLGRPCRLLEEGLAIYAETVGSAHERLCAVTAECGTPGLASLVEDTTFDSSDLFMTYPMAGSFVSFLVDRLGRKGLLELYPTPGHQLLARITDTLGLTPDELESAWWSEVRRSASDSPRDGSRD